MVSDSQLFDDFEAERGRLQRIAARILSDPHAAEDVVQQAWLRLHSTDEQIENLPGWLTTVTSRLCLDRLRARTPVPTESIEVEATALDPADDVVLADTVGIALPVALLALGLALPESKSDLGTGLPARVVQGKMAAPGAQAYRQGFDVPSALWLLVMLP